MALAAAFSFSATRVLHFPFVKRWLLIFAVLATLVLGTVAYRMLYQYPKPQIQSNAGNPVPDFTLPDQDGKPFTLSSLRGAPVVLIFYRGYW